MTLCKDCEHWGPAGPAGLEGWNFCNLVREDKAGKDSLAVCWSAYYGDGELATAPDFGCVQGRPKAAA